MGRGEGQHPVSQCPTHSACALLLQVHHAGVPQDGGTAADSADADHSRVVAPRGHRVQEERGLPRRHRVRQHARASSLRRVDDVTFAWRIVGEAVSCLQQVLHCGAETSVVVTKLRVLSLHTLRPWVWPSLFLGCNSLLSRCR